MDEDAESAAWDQYQQECLQWLTKMQREDGSFGETLGPGDKIEGGMDTRFGYCATGVRWVLREVKSSGVSEGCDRSSKLALI